MSICWPGRKADDHTHRMRRIGLRPRDPRDRWERSSTRRQMQKLMAGKFQIRHVRALLDRRSQRMNMQR
jgi:hypothetical protein